MRDQRTIPQESGSAQAESPTLPSGTLFGRYLILGPIGAGGMGEVYRAQDTQLGRELAIKVLSQKLAADDQELERFEQEARSASALNHPNIVTIFEMGKIDSTYYIAMELVEGELLREMLDAGPIPLQTAIQIAAQTADGLAKAHDAGIVHRDLKPENLMISRDRFVKILDFGLAKLTYTEEGKNNSTVRTHLTRPGMVMGTVAYMSPEQASGLPLDFRSDQFSFGSVLYEMLAGRRGFQGRNHAETVAAILRDNPLPIGSLCPRVPAPLCWLIERCLAKDPNERYPSTRDLARDLATIRDRYSESSSDPLPGPPANIPVQRTVLIGREREVEAITDLLFRDGVPLVTLTGPGGIGKSRLSLQVAVEVADSFPGGVHFVPLASVADPALVPSVIANTLGIRETGRQAMDRLKEHLQELRLDLLVILDNFEQVISAATCVSQLLAVTPRLTLLVTSRAPLHIYGEREFPVPPLDLPDLRATRSVTELSRNPAITLFLERAAAVKPNFELTEDNALAVATICTRLDGLPLAIELAAARIKLLSPSAMQARLESRLQLLTGGAKDLPLRQQTLRGAIDWSYDLLSKSGQALLRRVSVFAGGCTLEGVEAVCNTQQDLEVDVFDGMASLVDNSLARQVDQPEGDPRFVLLDTVREYGLECLAASGEENATKRAHAAYCLVLAEEYASENQDPTQTDWIKVFELEHDNFRAALAWLTKTGDVDWGLRLGAALFQFWETKEHLSEGRDVLVKLLSLEGSGARSITRARALFAAGVLAGELGDYPGAQALGKESLEIARELDDMRAVGIALNALAVHSRNLGDLEGARAMLEESLAVWRGLGDGVVVARSVSNLANMVCLQGQFDLARSLYKECLAMFADLGDRAGMAWSLNYEGDVAHQQGDDAAAHALYQQGLAIFREVGEKWGIAGCLIDLGNLACDQQHYASCYSYYTESMSIFRELGQKRGIARLLDCLACCAALRSDHECSLRLAGAAAAMRRVLGAPLTPSEQTRLEKMLDHARRSVPPSVAAAAWMEGWTSSPDRLIHEALPCE